MKQLSKILLLLIFSLMLFSSCDSLDQNKPKSKDYVRLADEIIREHTKYSEEDTSVNSALLMAMVYLDKAIELDSTNAVAYQNQIMLLTILGNRTSEIIKPLLKLLELKPDFAEGYIQIGLVYESLKNYDSANFAYRKAKNSFLKRPVSDDRNYNLLFLEFLTTKDKTATLGKLKEFDIKDPDLKKQLILEIDEWGNINRK